jgi:hypothetical protein
MEIDRRPRDARAPFMMYPRLRLLHKLLTDDRLIFISIDERVGDQPGYMNTSRCGITESEDTPP